MQTRKAKAETRQTRIVFQEAVNDQQSLFGGNAMKWMDEVAYITALRFCRHRVVTSHVEQIRFLKPIPVGTIVDVLGKVESIDRLKIRIKVELQMVDCASNLQGKAIEGYFSFVAIDDCDKLQTMTKVIENNDSI